MQAYLAGNLPASLQERSGISLLESPIQQAQHALTLGGLRRVVCGEKSCSSATVSMPSPPMPSRSAHHQGKGE